MPISSSSNPTRKELLITMSLRRDTHHARGAVDSARQQHVAQRALQDGARPIFSPLNMHHQKCNGEPIYSSWPEFAHGEAALRQKPSERFGREVPKMPRNVETEPHRALSH